MAESLSAAQRRRVYIHCRPIFSGANAQVRRRKKIQELVNKSKKSLQPLLNEIGQKKVTEILRSLLERRIFESEVHAKSEFPDLFRPSSVRDIKRQVSEDDAARSTKEVLESIASRHSERSDIQRQVSGGDPARSTKEALESTASRHSEGSVIDEEDNSELDEHPELVRMVNGEHKVEPSAPTEICLARRDLPSLYPSYLPYQTQHVILTTAQRVLEECCFDFAAAALPPVLQENGWECPMAVELTKWTRLFRKGKSKLAVQTIPTDFTSKEAQEMLTAVEHLRHTAVHRLPTTAWRISQLLDAAVKLAQTLQDNLRSGQLDELRGDIVNQIKAMELNKNVLEDTVSAEVQKIQQKREELGRLETELIQRMLADDKNYKTLIGRLLEDSLHRIFRGEEKDKDNEKGKKGDEREDGGLIPGVLVAGRNWLTFITDFLGSLFFTLSISRFLGLSKSNEGGSDWKGPSPALGG